MCTRAAFVGRWVEARPNALRPSIVPLLRHTTLLPAHIRQHRSRRTTCPATETNHGGVAERQLPKPLQQQLASLGIAERDVLPLSAHYGFVENAEASLALIGGLNSKQLSAKLVAAHPELLCVQLDSWLDFLTSYGVSKRDFFRLLSSNPRLFTQGSLFNAGSIMAWLQGLGLTPRDVSSNIVPRCSVLLLHDLHTQLMPAASFLASELQLAPCQVRDVLCRCPRVLLMDVVSDLRPKLLYLRTTAGYGEEDMRRLFMLNASLLVGDVVDTLRQRTSFMRGCGFTDAEAQAICRSCPEVLSLSLPNLTRKWKFLSRTMLCGPAHVVAYPGVWAKSLLLDIGPRLSYVKERYVARAGAGRPAAAGAGAGAGAGGGTAAESRAGEAGGINLQQLLDCDESGFVAQLAGEWAGSSDGESALEAAREDYELFRNMWMETEGVRWADSRAVGTTAAGSW